MIPRAVWWACLLLLIPGSSAFSADTLPIFDAHIHLSADAAAQYTPEQVIEILDRAGIERALVSSSPNDGTRALYEKYPSRIVPEVRPYFRRGETGSWHSNADVIALVESELKRGIYRGIGEFHLYTGQADTPVVRRMVQLAVERSIPLHAHSDEGAIRELFAIDPKAKILWAHAGMSTGPDTIRAMLEKYPTLWVELSLRSGDVAPIGRLSAAWRELFLRYPDRFVVGTDTWMPSRWEDVESENRIVRAWLAQLPPEVAEKIAFRNAARLYPR
jgi:hypothetical protein